MGGNSLGYITDDIHYALRITFGIVHGVILTLFSFGLALFFPSLSQFLFALFGCVVIPLISFILTIFCNGCIEYVAQSTLTVARILKTAWIPPVGVFCVNLFILPLELLPFTGPLNTLLLTSIIINLMITTVLQVYAARDIQLNSIA
jgi:hypothetical protein